MITLYVNRELPITPGRGLRGGHGSRDTIYSLSRLYLQVEDTDDSLAEGC